MQIKDYKLTVIDPDNNQALHEFSSIEEVKGVFKNNYSRGEVFTLSGFLYEIEDFVIKHDFDEDGLSATVDVFAKKMGPESDYEEVE